MSLTRYSSICAPLVKAAVGSLVTLTLSACILGGEPQNPNNTASSSLTMSAGSTLQLGQSTSNPTYSSTSSSGSMWYNTTTNTVDYYNGTSNQTVLSVNSSTGAMTSPLNMGGNSITNLASPVNPGDAVNLSYLTGGTASLSVNGATIGAGGINMNGNSITNLAAPVNPGDAVNKSYLTSYALPLAGGTMTGAINMGGTNQINSLATPTLSTDAANKGYVDTAAMCPGPASCTAPFVLVGTANSREAYCIDSAAQAAATQPAAFGACLSAGAHLCTRSEWMTACALGKIAPTGAEWVADVSPSGNGTWGLIYGAACTTVTVAAISSSYASRCCHQ